MKSNLRIYHENDSAIILGAFMQYNIIREQSYVILMESGDTCDLTYAFYIASIETLILHSMRAAVPGK